MIIMKVKAKNGGMTEKYILAPGRKDSPMALASILIGPVRLTKVILRWE